MRTVKQKFGEFIRVTTFSDRLKLGRLSKQFRINMFWCSQHLVSLLTKFMSIEKSILIDIKSVTNRKA